MELEELFRNLITGKYDPNTDYNGLEFSFKTACQMFPGPQYTLYRGCPCSVEHEFMLYWKNGTINIDILNRVAQNIINGKCPHVEETTPTEPRSEKTGLRGFRPGPTQTGLYSHRR